MLRNRLGVFIGVFIGALVGVQSSAEAARVNMTAGSRGIVIWDGGKDVSSMNATGVSDVGAMTFDDASQVVVDYTTIGIDPSENLFPRAFLIVSGADGAGSTTLQKALCPGSVPGQEYCTDLSNALQNTTIEPQQFDDSPENLAKIAFIEAENRVAFGAFLTFDGTSHFTIDPAAYAAFNATLAGVNNGTLRVGLITYISRSLTPGVESVQFTTRKGDGTQTEVPEPASLALLGTGLATLIARKRVRRG